MPRQLVVIAGPDKGRSFPLQDGASFCVGRGDESDTKLTDPAASRNHCQIQVNGESVLLIDQGSSGGTIVNEMRVTICELAPGDIIGVGETQLRFEESKPQVPKITIPPIEIKPAIPGLSAPKPGGAGMPGVPSIPGLQPPNLGLPSAGGDSKAFPQIPLRAADKQMPGKLSELVLRSRPKSETALSFVTPYAAYLVFMFLSTRMLYTDNYPLFTVVQFGVVAGLLWMNRDDLPSLNFSGMLYALPLGLIAGIAWIGLDRVGLEGMLHRAVPALFPLRPDYDPFKFISSPAFLWTYIAFRFLAVTIALPIAAEVFWRGFLPRYLADPENFSDVEIGEWSPKTFAIVTLAFPLLYHELIAALLLGLGLNILLRFTRNLWTCVAAHILCNLTVMGTALALGDWTLWRV